MFLRRLFRKKKIKDEEVFSGVVKKMDVRRGSFLWLHGPRMKEEFVGDFSITRVEVDLPEKVLMQRVETKTKSGLTRVKLKEILDNLANHRKFFKFVKLRFPIHVRIVGEKGGDVIVYITNPKSGKEK
jgi:hypothetical protein